MTARVVVPGLALDAKAKKVYLVNQIDQAGDYARSQALALFGDFGRAVTYARMKAEENGTPVALKKSWSNRKKADQIKAQTEAQADKNVDAGGGTFLPTLEIEIRPLW